tara:strand:+ start:428 stop:697 length:270 start_codon:yes stop_codon:yes gene_type:complete
LTGEADGVFKGEAKEAIPIKVAIVCPERIARFKDNAPQGVERIRWNYIIQIPYCIISEYPGHPLEVLSSHQCLPFHRELLFLRLRCTST